MEINYEILKNMESEIKTLLENQYKSTKSPLLQDSTVLQYPQANLDNCTNAVQMPLNQEGANSVAKHRLRVCVGYNDDGSQVIKQASGKTEIELADNIAKAILNSERRNVFVGGEIVKTTPILQDYYEEWLNTYKLKKLRGTTATGYKSILQGHIYPVMGKLPLNQISPKDIQSFLDGQNEFSKKEYSKKYLLEMKNLLSQILDGALTDGYITINPAKDSRIVIPSEKKKERRALSIDEIKQAIQALTKLQGRDLLFWTIIIFTGMRRGEVLALKWEDIDLQNNIIHVHNNVTFDGNKPCLGKTKTSSGERNILIQPKLLDYILPLKGHGFVIGGSDKPITLTPCRGIINRGLKAIGIDGISAHYFRHSLGTLLNDV